MNASLGADRGKSSNNTNNYNFSNVALYIVVILIFYIISVLFLFKAFSTKDDTNVYLNESIIVDDTVILKENNYYKEQSLTNQNRYIAALIDKIKLDFNYVLTLSDEIDYDISYYVDSLFYIYEIDHPENVLWKNEKILIDKTDVDNSLKNTLKLNETVEIDYNEYNQQVKDFVKNYVLLTDSKLRIDLHFVMSSVDPNYSDDFNYEKVVTVEIPMNEQTISIEKTNDKLNNVVLSKSVETFNVLSIVYLLLGITSSIIAAIFLFKLFVLLRNYVFNTTPYQKALNKILTTYDHLIVNSTTYPDIDGLSIIEVTTFDELLDAQEELRMPIIHYEIVKHKKSIFVIINNNSACVYYLQS